MVAVAEGYQIGRSGSGSPTLIKLIMPSSIFPVAEFRGLECEFDLAVLERVKRYLAGMPVDLVKFDISLVRSLEVPGRQAVFVEDLARLIKECWIQAGGRGNRIRDVAEQGYRTGFFTCTGIPYWTACAVGEIASCRPSRRWLNPVHALTGMSR